MGAQVSKVGTRTKRILHILSIIGSSMIVFGALSTFGFLIVLVVPILQKPHLGGMPLYPFIVTAGSVSIMIRYFKFSSPYK